MHPAGAHYAVQDLTRQKRLDNTINQDRHALKWPHVIVGMSGAARQTVEDRVTRDGLERRIGAHIPEFSGIGPLLAASNMLATNAKPFLGADVRTYGLVARRPPIDLPDVTFRAG